MLTININFMYKEGGACAVSSSDLVIMSYAFA